ncbi:DNA polymerase III subunit delta' [Paraglaciecola sp. L3A3]|uniref:DNA polymerase III subunit delta' n=1 Tax=Paraglaciecola sp. L3A3 TaxID=2686358 RepID=UPI00131E700A|nr:DNA polymerase III subunit delta' [Paraglaciecola sp. L3A3]
MYPWLSKTFLQLSERIAGKKLHHAILVQGPSGLGKTKFVLNLAELLLCANPQLDKTCGTCQSCRLNAASTHPDLHQVESEKQIGVDLIRDAIKKLVGSAQMSGVKVLIIHHADTMTESSANALLKTLEEPTSSTFILLTTAKPERILPTIKSRCEKLILPSPDFNTSINWVRTQYAGAIDPQFAKLFAARPLALLDELQQEQKFTFELFKQGIVELTSGHKSATSLAIEWQEHTDKVIKWSQFWVREQVSLVNNHTVVVNLYAVEKKATKISQQLRNPGVNKILQLAGLLTAISLIPSY